MSQEGQEQNRRLSLASPCVSEHVAVPAENSIGLLPNRRLPRCLNGRRDDHVALWAVNRNI